MKTVDVTGEKQAEAFPDLEKRRKEIAGRIKFLRSEKERLSYKLIEIEKELDVKIDAHNGLLEVMNKLCISEEVR